MRGFAAAPSFLATALWLFGLAASSPAVADITHVVQRGHTLEAIAHRYHVSVKALLDANHLNDPRSLRPGQELVIPGVDGPKSGRSKTETKREAGEPAGHAGRSNTALLERIPERRREESDSVHAVRLGEQFHIRVRDSRGRIPASALKAFERMMRQGGATHPVDPRLVARIGIVSNHFGGRTFEVVSGFRAYTPTQYTPHSNHNHGRALDFRIRGVPNETLRDFCRTLRGAGCGYYPNSTFVHLDVRDTKAYWVDWSHPGEPPQYDKPEPSADEGTSDVPDETTTGASEGSAAPSADPPPPQGSPETHPSTPIGSHSE